MKTTYELMAIIRSDITDKDIQARLSGLRELLGSEITFDEVWGIRPFAYHIKNQEKGYYAVFNFAMDTAILSDLEGNLRLYPDLLRYLLIKVPEGYQPMRLAEIEAGLEALRKAKSVKRGSGRSAKEKRSEDEKKKPMEMKAEKGGEASLPTGMVPKAKETAPIAPAKAVEKPEPPVKRKTLDEKLKDIMSDDDLGL